MDLDQSGNPEHVVRTYLGPSLGWANLQVNPPLMIAVGGTYTVPPGVAVILINSLTPVTINLPDVQAWINETAYKPATGFERTIIIKDLGGNASSANITVVPFTNQNIDYTAGNFVLNQNHQILHLLPMKTFTGWFAMSQVLGAGGGGSTSPGGSSGQIQWNNAGAFGGFTMSGDAAITTAGVLTVQPAAITYAKIQNVSTTGRFLGRVSAGAGPPEEITSAQATSLIGLFTPTTAGLVGASAGGTTNFLRADGSWVAPPGGSSALTVGTTTITGGATGTTLYDNAGVLGERTGAQLVVTLPIFGASAQGVAPASGGGTVNYLRADGTWASPPGSGGTNIGTTTITSGSSGNFLYDNAGVYGELTPTQTTAALNIFTPSLKGLAPSSGGGTINFLRADGTWAAPTVGAASLVVGSSTVSSGVSGNFLYDNAGILGEQTPTQVTSNLNIFTSALKGLAPSSGGGTTNFLRADGTWAAPPVSGGITIGTTAITGGTSGNTLYDNAGVVGERTATQLTAILNQFTTALQGVVPSSGGGTVNYLRADGAWAAPPGTAGITIGTTPITGGTSGNFLYNNAGKVGELTPTAATAALNTFTSSTKGLVPASGGGAISFMRTDGGWAEAVQPSLSTNFTVGYTFTPYNAGTVSGSFTPTPANGNYQYMTATGSPTIQIPSVDCAIDLLVTNGSGISSINMGAGYSVGSNTGDAYDTVVGHKFIFSIRRINAVATWILKALQ